MRMAGAERAAPSPPVLPQPPLLQVMIDIDGKHEWRDCIDVPGVRLPRGYYFGTSSVTGDLSGTTTGPRVLLPEQLWQDLSSFGCWRCSWVRGGARGCARNLAVL